VWQNNQIHGPMFWQQVILVDNFYPDPLQVRSVALNDTTETSSHGNYAGRMTDNKLFDQSFEEIFQHLTNQPVVESGNFCGRFRFTQESDTMTQYIHFDPAPGQVWAGLVYLSLPEDIDAAESPTNHCGTEFWQHRRTGLDCIPIEPDEQRRHGLTDLQVFLETEGNDASLWNQTLYVPPRFNRLILFRPWMFHSPGRSFGTNKQNCRLVQLFFLRLPKDIDQSA